MSENTKYFNFPITYLDGFLDPISRSEILSNIVAYSVYEYSTKIDFGDEWIQFEKACDHLNISFGDMDKVVPFGRKLFEDNKCKVLVGINTSIYWDYHNNEKTEFEVISLLAFLAVKSIVQNNPFAKITNEYLLSRMAGNTNKVELDTIPKEILNYNTEYKMRKIKHELQVNWGVNHYARYTRGFYVSFKMDLVSLIKEVEKRRKSRKVKALKEKQEDAFKKAINELNNEVRQ